VILAMSQGHQTGAGTNDGCLGTSQLVAFLDGELSASDRGLAESHLAGCDDCRELISALAPELTAPDPPLPHATTQHSQPLASTPPQLVSVGEVVGGKYRVTRLLGQGGMGVVMAAEHLVLHTPVALKFLLPGPGLDRRASARFLREARVSARLSSEHIARVLDYGLLPGSGAPYLVLEYLEGEDLSELLERRGPPPLDAAFDLLFQAAEGLAVAHQAGVIHRDLKPANLFVTTSGGGSPRVKLLDFGIAKAERFDTQSAGVTTGDAFIGSPRYASPEQLQSARSVDARTDIWAFGCVAYELLTGRPAFDGDTLTSLIASILTSEPRPLRELDARIPLEVDQAVLRCLRKSPEDRVQGIAELLAAMVPFASDEARVISRRVARLGGASLAPHAAAPASIAPAAAGSAGAGLTAAGTLAAAATTSPQRPTPRPRWALPVLAAAVLSAIALAGLFATSARRAGPGAPEPSPAASLVPPATVAPVSSGNTASDVDSAPALASARRADPSAEPPPPQRPGATHTGPAPAAAGPRSAPRAQQPTRPAAPTTGSGAEDRK
jgi:eukaryotic-like serine/threonine-protein kinase